MCQRQNLNDSFESENKNMGDNLDNSKHFQNILTLNNFRSASEFQVSKII